MSKQRIEFEWRIHPQVTSRGRLTALVIERLAGTDHMNVYGPMPSGSAEPFVKIRRAFVNRRIHTMYAALQVFEKRPVKIPKQKVQRSELEDDEVPNWDTETP